MLQYYVSQTLEYLAHVAHLLYTYFTTTVLKSLDPRAEFCGIYGWFVKIYDCFSAKSGKCR